MNPETKLIIGLCAAILFYSCGLFAYQQSVDGLELEAALKSPNVQVINPAEEPVQLRGLKSGNVEVSQ
jgi:hypothetical protein